MGGHPYVMELDAQVRRVIVHYYVAILNKSIKVYRSLSFSYLLKPIGGHVNPSSAFNVVSRWFYEIRDLSDRDI